MQLNDLVWYATAGVLAAAGLSLLAWSLLWDRSRGRLRCPKCWYRMEQVPLDASVGQAVRTCPECGRKSLDEHKLRRCRRHWGWVSLAAIIFLLAISSAAFPVIRREGWALVPTNALVELVPIGGHTGPFGQELMHRLGRTGPRSWKPPTASDEELAYVARRLGSGNILARPMSERWKQSFGRIIHETYLTVFSLDIRSLREYRGPEKHAAILDAARTWYELPQEVTFRTRSRWPEGCHLWVDVQTREYWPWPTSLGIDIRRTGSDEEYHDIGPNDGFRCREKDASTGIVRLDVKLTQVRQGDTPDKDWERTPRIELERRVIEIPYVIAGTIDEILTPVKSAKLDELVRGLRYEVGDGLIVFDTDSAEGGAADGIAFGMILDFYLDGKLLASQRWWWDGTEPDDRKDRRRGSEWIAVVPKPLHFKSPWDATSDEHWTIKARSDPETALRVIDRVHYWEGEVDIPLVVGHR